MANETMISEIVGDQINEHLGAWPGSSKCDDIADGVIEGLRKRGYGIYRLPSRNGVMASKDKTVRAREAILENLRDRRMLKYLFDENPETCGPYGRVDHAIDLDCQHECAETLAQLVFAIASEPNKEAE